MQKKIKHSLFVKSYNKNNKNVFNNNNINKTKISYSNNIFPTALNDISKIYKNKINLTENKYGNTKYNKTENNFFSSQKKFPKISKIKLSKINKNVKDVIDINNKDGIISKFREYQKQIEPSLSLIRNEGYNISKNINNNPFMRKIENLKDINQFEIIFHKSIMNNIMAVHQKSKTGFFQGDCCGVNTNKDKSKGIYICENRSNIFNVTEMIDRMNPSSVVKFNELLRKDYKEFLGYNKKDYRNKKAKKEDELRKKLIKKYHRELFYENDLADKYNIKKNTGIKFIQEDDNENEKIKLK